ncbi:mechanosensitive ion channel domain-containing protein [Flavobacterium sp. ST-87]|uniref:Mechanosensitive ion channel domain-containing protein n=1 Tax=Flavobacterium plantiphilum TaxID=3163297 RepID=A0ABW8XSL1_9FLAO
MNSEVHIFKESVYQSWINLVAYFPSILLSVFVFLVGLLFIRLINKYSKKIIISKANDPLIADFILSIISLVLTVLLLVIALGILGFDNVTNQILAGAGLTTFIIGFALKDIGENFIAGILMAFQRPFRIGDLIEIEGIKGRVIEMKLRSTTLKTTDGVDAYIPNGSILKNNLKNYTIDELMRDTLIVKARYDDPIDAIIKAINIIINENPDTLKNPPPYVVIDTIDNDFVNLVAYYWYSIDQNRVPAVQLKSELQLKIHSYIKSVRNT